MQDQLSSSYLEKVWWCDRQTRQENDSVASQRNVIGDGMIEVSNVELVQALEYGDDNKLGALWCSPL